MEKKRAALGYREVVILKASPFAGSGARVKGHEYHYSKISGKLAKSVGCSFAVLDEGVSEGYTKNKTIASYVHLHFASNRALCEGLYKGKRAIRKNMLE